MYQESFMRQAPRHLLTLTWLIATLWAGAVTQGQTTFFNGVEVPGTVIRHSPASSGVYLGSPSIAILSNGDYVASFDIFGPGSPSTKRTDVYRSVDGGQNWSLLSILFNQTWSGMFVHNGDLYILGTNGVYGHLVVRKSTNGGVTWSTPVDSTSGVLKTSTGALGYHTAPVPVVVSGGRLWRAYEDNGGSGAWPSQYRAGMMSISVDADLLDAGNWQYTNVLSGDESWLPYVPASPSLGGYFNGWLEGNAVVDPSGQVVDVLRVDVENGRPESAAIARVQDTTTLTIDPYSDIVAMPGGAKKFSIRYSEVTGTYWTLASIVNENNYDPNKPPGVIRNTVALMQSPNLADWTVVKIVIEDLSDVTKIGFQYLDWRFDGRDIVAVSRTSYPDGLGGADSYHNSNFINFHRFQNVLPPLAVDGDLDGDGFVGIEDLNIVLGAWNQTTPPADPAADPSGNGFVGIEDLNLVLGNWNAGTPPNQGVSTPEPTTLIILGLGLLPLTRRQSVGGSVVLPRLRPRTGAVPADGVIDESLNPVPSPVPGRPYP
jgi:hypothetical protein